MLPDDPRAVSRGRAAIEAAALALAYLVLGRLGQAVAVQQVTAVFPPAGLALALLLLRGTAVAPGVWLGSFALNSWYLHDKPPGTAIPVAIVMALGATAGVLAGRALLRRQAGGAASLERTENVLRFVAFGAAAPATIAATIGVTALCASGIERWDGFAVVWGTWWLGDLAGIMIVAPLVLAWVRPSAPIPYRRALDAVALFGLVALVGRLAAGGHRPLEYMYIPCLVAARSGSGPRGATVVLAAVSVIAPWVTIHGHGSFALGELWRLLFALKTFIAIIATPTLLLSAALSGRNERTRGARRSRIWSVRAPPPSRRATAKARSTASMSHELRTPLNAVISWRHAPRGTGGPADLGRYLRKIKAAAEHLLILVGDILDMAMLEAGKTVLSVETFPVAPLVDEVAAAARVTTAPNGNDLRVDAAEAPPSLRADRAKTKDALMHLLSNACKFTTRGRVDRAREEWRAAVLRASPWRTRGSASRPPISAGSSTFTQVDESKTRRYGGTGLGLVIAQRYCHLMGGSITAQSEPGKGSTFTIRLPG
ncbi:MAG: MASE1 domain-containing protein [Acidobacteriota bacterium]